MTVPEPPPGCDFCYRTAVTRVQAHRRTPMDIIRGREPKSVHVCNDHLARGIEEVR